MKSGKNIVYSDYRQSFTMKMYQASIVISLAREGKIEIIKNRWGPPKTEDVSTEEVIDIITTILAKHLFCDRMDIFQEGLKQQLIEVINKTIKGGVTPCDQHSKNELLKWGSNV